MEIDNIKIEGLLTQLGLSDQAAATYLALLELETVSIRKVASSTGINRGTTYDVIKKLINFGLVSTRHKAKREYFTAESPEKIYELIRDKRRDLVRIMGQLQEVMPALLAKSTTSLGRPKVKYYEDDEGIVVILKDVLQTCAKLNNREYYVYSSKPLRQYLYRKFPQFTSRRIAEAIAVKVIAIGDGGDPAAVSERKWLPEPAGSEPSSYTIIYGDKIAVISIASDYTPYGIVIEDKGAASMQHLLFEHMWRLIK
jgi:sugar-specific transcriptional regulator TrmB